ncbi:pirin family protein [Paenibacillus sp.]|uniref:pirin family protein n=1 Tax=Paenibacillus sp. TaxID=58172 RepID=UPI0028120FC6|nr:pirin family protein [Paenibacillus sp.]
MEGRSIGRRGIRSVWDAVAEPRGGSHVKAAAVLEPGRWREFDPFLLMMEDWFQAGTFDFHPHRGFETVTYVIEGRLKHEDSYGGYGILEPGDVQWMTAGRGIIHSEDPLPGETVHSLQLWLNLPKSEKMTAPRYQDLKAANMPARRESGATVRVFSGASGDVAAETKNVVPVTFLDIAMEPGATLTQRLPADYNGFLYVLEGSGRFGVDETPGAANQVLWLGAPDDADAEGSELVLRADAPLRAVLAAGRPIGEPVVQQGPFVMTTVGDIKLAIQDFYAGKFGKPRKS